MADATPPPPSDTLPGPDYVTLSPATADALDTFAGRWGNVSRLESPERLAWLCLVLREVKDSPTAFPLGKWATIQALEERVQREALKLAAQVNRELGMDYAE